MDKTTDGAASAVAGVTSGGARLFSLPDRGAQQRMRDRLDRALVSLTEALAEQQAAVAEWRRSLAALGTCTQHLGRTFGTYQQCLGTLQQDVAALNAHARALAETAARAEAISAPPSP